MKTYKIVLLIFILVFSCDKNSKEIFREGSTMGTQYHITLIESSDYLPPAVDSGIDSVLKEINRQMSTWDTKSEISRLNKAQENIKIPISEDFLKTLLLSMKISKLSNEAFDITVGPLVNYWGFGYKNKKGIVTGEGVDSILSFTGMEFIQLEKDAVFKKDNRAEADLSAVAKGYGVDAVARYLKKQGFLNGLVEIGGEVFAWGQKTPNTKWRLGIDTPDDMAEPGASFQKIIKVENKGVATSGDYRNYYMKNGRRISHTIDPRTGYPIDHSLASVTVISSSCAFSDGLATAIMVLGAEEGMKLVESLDKVECLLVVRKETGFSNLESSGFSQYYE